MTGGYDGFGLGGKRVLVTGGSIGIGAAAAKAFAEAGAKVAIHYNKNREKAEALAAELGGAPVFGGDFSRTDAVKSVIEDAIGKLGGLDVLVNNAGHMVARFALSESDDEAYDRVMDLNARSVMTATRVAVPALIESKGNIVNTSSIAARNGGAAGAALYASAKGFVSTYTKSIATELAPQGIRVNAVSPGVIHTYFHDIYSTPERLEQVRQRIPMQRLGVSEDCAGAFLFLASEKLAGYITGQVIEVNGGQLMP
ncbi:MAG TPA: SDR family oxidoreductase [Geminicoccus sp.]|uniref:SDR family NAD(P)-dependent oxidoreductase n=1 Tax=Geminicoccus sp. TaxID=2024832 RepID=UPI002C2CDF21|nr:SDR family oxidoreductase [Geminicoccus sp.]HWL68002.1 SDR family oxidoreductase [Geminicoccus sp.]